jgi:hypothetical protein
MKKVDLTLAIEKSHKIIVMKYRNTYQNISLSLFLLVALSVWITPKPAYSIPTKWGEAGMSMSDLIDSGWQVIGHGTNRVAANSNAGNGFDLRTFSFLLVKGNKYIMCAVENPLPPIANAASCRKLN